MRPAAALALGFAAYAAFVVAGIPAGVATSRIEAASAGRASFARVAGTVWNGTASAKVAMNGPALALEEVKWRFLPSRILAGRAAFDVGARAAGLDATLEIARTPGTWQVRDLHAGGDASAVAAFAPLAAAWQPAGTLAIEAPLVVFEGGAASGKASAQWLDASLSLSAIRPLGAWRAELEADNGPARVSLATLKGPLRLSGRGTFDAAGRLAFTGEARAEPGREPELEPLLRLLGARRADGAYPIEVR